MAQTQALNVLLEALPSAAASSLVNQMNTVQPTTLTSITLRSTSSILSTVTSTSTTSSSTNMLSSIPQSSTASLASTASSITGTVATLSNPSLSPGVIVGITLGSISAVLIMLFVLLFFIRSRWDKRHRRSGSETSLLGSTRGGDSKKKNQVFPEVAWLYNPMPSDSQSTSIPPLRNSGPQMGANAPWNSRPSTAVEYERTLTALPTSGVAEMSALPGTPGFSRAADLTRQLSYPLRTTFPTQNMTQDTSTPLLPPLPKAVISRESLEHHAITTDENTDLRAREPAWTGAFRGNAVRPSMDGRPQTRHGNAQPAREPTTGAF